MNKHSASLFLLLLLLADVVFIALHGIHELTSFLQDELYSLEIRKSYAEVFQYIKWFWIGILFAAMAIQRRSFAYVAWVLVFIYLLCDDSFSIHERIGSRIAAKLTFAPPFGLRLQDLGELAVSATAGLILLAIVGCAYLFASSAFRKISKDLVLLILTLAFFGVFLDMAHSSVRSWENASFVFGTIEDSGEMLVASVILWYVFLQSSSAEHATSYLCDFICARRRAGMGAVD